MNFFKLAACLLTTAALGGCAHSVVISPNPIKLVREAGSPPKINAKVGYYISDSVRAAEVTTPGGGGDKVTSVPYRDVEGGLYVMLGNVFDGVTLLKAPADAQAMRSSGIRYIITPEIKVSSSSPSALTWPPTLFDVDLLLKISDADGNLIDSPKVVGHGAAEFAEFKGDHGLAGKRATEDALIQMQRKLLVSKVASPTSVAAAK